MIQFETACEEMPPQSVATAVGPPSSETICWTVLGVGLVASMLNCNHTYAQNASMLTAEPVTMAAMNEAYGERVRRLRESKEPSITEAARVIAIAAIVAAWPLALIADITGPTGIATAAPLGFAWCVAVALYLQLSRRVRVTFEHRVRR